MLKCVSRYRCLKMCIDISISFESMTALQRGEEACGLVSSEYDKHAFNDRNKIYFTIVLC